MRPKRLKRPTADIEAAAKRAARSALSVQIAKSMSRDSNGHFKRARDPKPPPPKTAKRVRSRVTNGRSLFFSGPATTAEARRFADILGQIISDLGGVDAPLSEGQRQLARRAASLSVACEKLEQAVCSGTSSAAEARAAGGDRRSIELRDPARRRAVRYMALRAAEAATRSRQWRACPTPSLIA